MRLLTAERLGVAAVVVDPRFEIADSDLGVILKVPRR
jgi:hypothetical protein